MNRHNLNSMSVDELWSFHELVVSVLARKISSERARLEQKLRELSQNTPASIKKVSHHARRPYPEVFPKYRNPVRPSETWAGRGKQPRWLTAELRSGKKLDDFRIIRAASIGRGAARKVVPAETKGPPRGGRLDSG
jgi:DNA-binding protein H-NS